jgi:AAA+ superfamily predicted ATPase
MTFDDVARLENAKRDLQEITGYLKKTPNAIANWAPRFPRTFCSSDHRVPAKRYWLRR